MVDGGWLRFLNSLLLLKSVEMANPHRRRIFVSRHNSTAKWILWCPVHSHLDQRVRYAFSVETRATPEHHSSVTNYESAGGDTEHSEGMPFGRWTPNVGRIYCCSRTLRHNSVFNANKWPHTEWLGQRKNGRTYHVCAIQKRNLYHAVDLKIICMRWRLKRTRKTIYNIRHIFRARESHWFHSYLWWTTM